jgi:hypothetical protein
LIANDNPVSGPNDFDAGQNLGDLRWSSEALLDVVLPAASKVAGRGSTTPPTPPKIPPRLDLLERAAGALLGDHFRIVPEFELDPATGDAVEASLAASRSGDLFAHLTDLDFPVDSWLHGLARVRPKLRDWEQAVMMAGSLGRPDRDSTRSSCRSPRATAGWGSTSRRIRRSTPTACCTRRTSPSRLHPRGCSVIATETANRSRSFTRSISPTNAASSSSILRGIGTCSSMAGAVSAST